MIVARRTTADLGLTITVADRTWHHRRSAPRGAKDHASVAIVARARGEWIEGLTAPDSHDGRDRAR